MSINVLSLSLPLPLSTLSFLPLPPWSCTYHSPTATLPFGRLHDQSVSQNEFINSDQVLSDKLGRVGDTITTVVSNTWFQLLDTNLAVLCSAAVREQSYNGDPSLMETFGRSGRESLQSRHRTKQLEVASLIGIFPYYDRFMADYDGRKRTRRDGVADSTSSDGVSAVFQM